VPFESPEDFGELDEKTGCCRRKLSDAIIESSIVAAQGSAKPSEFKKARHTSEMLPMADPQRVADRCPMFCEMWRCLDKLCASN